RDRGRGRARGRPAADRRPLHPRPGAARAAPPDLDGRSGAHRMDRTVGGAPMSATTIPARFAEAFGEWTPRAIVFDCDGLLLDTESVWQRTEDRVVADHGAQLREG